MDENGNKVVLDIRQVPEVLFVMRRELAKLLLAEAGAETNPEFAVRLRTIAAVYEMGMKRVPKA
jgi:hypothetical protein